MNVIIFQIFQEEEEKSKTLSFFNVEEIVSVKTD